MIKYNEEELRRLRKLRKRKYKTLTDWEKFLIKDNVRLWREHKKDIENIDLFDPQVLDRMNEGDKRRRGERLEE